MSAIFNINSGSYWDTRFEKNWEHYDGPRQSRFFARVAIENLPGWLINECRRERLTVVDWGCAQGDGTDVLASYLNAGQIFGVDFSGVAIQQAKERYPSICFLQKDWLSQDRDTDPSDTYDLIFSSNTLEHFHEPYKVLDVIGTRARKAVVLALPFREMERIDEHFYTFLAQNISIGLNNGFRLVWTKVIDCRNMSQTCWNGEQIVLVYADPKWADSLGLTLADCEISQFSESERRSTVLDQTGILHERIVELMRAIDERDLTLAQIHGDHENEIAILQTQHSTSMSEIADLEEKLASHEKELANFECQLKELSIRVASKEHEVLALKSSNSWVITRPLRFISAFIKNPRLASYNLVKFIFWRLPGFVRDRLHGSRHQFVRWVRRNKVASSHTTKKLRSPLDLDWNEFNKKVLARRADFKGIFLQEIVIDWNVPLFQRPQHIAAAFGRLGYLVIYRTDNWAGDDVDGFREVVKNVWLTNSDQVETIDGVVKSFYSTAYALTPSRLAKAGKRCKLIYEYIDHIDPQISGDQENIRRLIALKDFAFNGGADYVVASAKKLECEAVEEVGRDKVILAQNGVDTRHYRNPVHAKTVLPAELLAFREKYTNIIGYFGALAPWLWYDTLKDLIAERSDLGFVFIGPDYYGGVDKLPKASNVLYLGPIDYQILPAYAQRFDVCLIPFEPGEIARTTSPLKLFEYFALEKPVVVTSEMLECVAFPEVFSGDSAKGLSNAIDNALAVKDDVTFKARLARLADENDWDQRARAMEKVFENLKADK